MAQQGNYLPNFTTSKATTQWGSVLPTMPASICLTEKSNFPSDRQTAASRRRLPRPVPLNAPSLGFTEGPESPTWTRGANFQPHPQPGDGGTHATAPAEPGRDRTFVGSGTSPGVCWEGAGAQPRHIGLRKERFDLRTRRSEARRKGAWQGSREARRRRRGGSPGSPCKRGAPARGRRSRRGRGARRAEKPRKERALPSRGRLRGKGAQGAGTRTGRGTHRACGGGSAGRRGAGCILPPQAGFEALHGQVRAVPLPAGATRLPCARTLKSGLAAPAEEHTAVPAISAPPATWRPPATAGCQSQ